MFHTPRRCRLRDAVTCGSKLPSFPGPLNHLIRKNLRGMLSTLDFYVALLLSVAALAYRTWGMKLSAEALMPMTLLIIVALSSYAQCLFGLDGESGLDRYRLLPVSGWQVLLAKDAAFMALAMLLVLPLGSAGRIRRSFGGAGGGASRMTVKITSASKYVHGASPAGAPLVERA